MSTIPTDVNEKKIVINDTYGNKVELSHQAERIIVNYEAIAEMLITIGAADHIVGIDHFTKTNRVDISKKMRSDVKDIGDYQNFNVETISQMHPEELVIILRTTQLNKNLENLKILRPINILYFDCSLPERLNDEAYALGEMTGHQEGAQRYILFNQKYQGFIESRLSNLTNDEIPTIYIAYGTATVDSGVVGGNTSLNYIYNTLQVRNANANLNVSSSAVSSEWIFQKDPEIIFKMGHWGLNDGYNTRGDTIVFAYDGFINRNGYERLKAVKSDKVFIIDRCLMLNPRSVIGLVYLAKAIYPDRFADIDPDAVRREYAAEFGFGDEPGVEWFYPPFEPVNATAAGANATAGIPAGG